jgi:hypothetical protein
MAGGWSTPSPAALFPEITQYALYRRLDGPQGWFGRVQEVSPPPGFDLRIVQSIASRYTDYAILAHTLLLCVNVIGLFFFVTQMYCVRNQMTF